MNEELFKKLVAQATEDILGVKQVNQREFAELIVRECIEEFALGETNNVEIIQDRFAQCRKVAKHFGVE